MLSLSKNYKIIGGGLTGCVLAKLLPNSILYERDKLGGLCRDNKNYQEFIHILHTDDWQIWDFIERHTAVRPHTTRLGSLYNDRINDHPPATMHKYIFDVAYRGYSKKQWRDEIPPEAKKRIITSPDGKMFHNKYEGVPNFTELFKSLTKDTRIFYKKMLAKDFKKLDDVILTGPLDEFFGYRFGRLEYRGMCSLHFKSEQQLPKDFITMPHKDIPVQRFVDYNRLGYKGNYIGVEYACDAHHYPIRNEKNEKLYNRYKALADEKGLMLCGRLATYHYLNMDECIEQAFNLARELWKKG